MKVTDDFKADWKLFERRLVEDGETDIAGIKAQIKKDWDDPGLRECWITQIKEEADFMRELIAMGSKLNDGRMKCKKG